MDVGDWLRSLGLERYEQAFRDNEIDVDLLPNLTGDDLKDLGVALVGHRRRLLDAIARLRDATPDSDGAAAVGAIEPSAAVAEPGADHGGRPPLRPEAERRQLTVMFVDLVGSTALSAQARSRGDARGAAGLPEHGSGRGWALRGLCRQVHGRRRAGVLRLAAGARGRGRAGRARRPRGRGRGGEAERRRTGARLPRRDRDGSRGCRRPDRRGRGPGGGGGRRHPEPRRAPAGRGRAGRGGHRQTHPPARRRPVRAALP